MLENALKGLASPRQKGYTSIYPFRGTESRNDYIDNEAISISAPIRTHINLKAIDSFDLRYEDDLF